MYDPDLAAALAGTLHRLMRNRPNVIAFIASTLRDPATIRHFTSSIAANRLQVTHAHLLPLGDAPCVPLCDLLQPQTPTHFGHCDCESTTRLFFTPGRDASALLVLRLKALD